MPNFLKAFVVEHVQPENNFHLLRLRPEKGDLQFKSGQYIALKVASDQVNKYSLSGRPGQELMELIVDTSPGQRGSKYIESLKIDDAVEFLGPLGIFVLKADLSKQMLFIATGSGIAPLKSMIEDLLINKNEHRLLKLYFGLRYEEEVFLREYFEQLTNQFNNFKVILTLSRPGPGWYGYKGRVTDHLSSDIEDVNEFSAYLCGSGQMIADTENLLKAKGLPQERIYYEKFFD